MKERVKEIYKMIEIVDDKAVDRIENLNIKNNLYKTIVGTSEYYHACIYT